MTQEHVRAQPDGSDIRKVASDELTEIADVLAQAFYDDPVFGWIFQGDSRRMTRIRGAFDLFLRRIWFELDACYTTDRRVGAALWMPPGCWHVPYLRQLRLLPAVTRRFGRHSGRGLRLLSAMEREHPRDHHWYLPVVGVAPGWQGRGFGEALMRPVLNRCDEDGAPAYLEASTPRNRALYQRLGFEVTKELRVASSPPLWLMWREPVR